MRLGHSLPQPLATLQKSVLAMCLLDSPVGYANDRAQSYFARAYEHLPVVLSMQDMTALQALLTLVQYSFRAQVCFLF